MTAATPLGFHARARRYMAQQGREWDPHRMWLDQATSRQRRRLMHKERRTWRRLADAGACEWQASYDEDEDYGQGLGYCVTPGCNCCGGDD